MAAISPIITQSGPKLGRFSVNIDEWQTPFNRQGLSVTTELIASMVLAIWLYFLFGRGGFWLAGERDDDVPAGEGAWPAVTAVIPARDEAECIGATVAALLRQDYPGEFAVIVVDDQSRDATAEAARAAAAGLGATERLKVLSGRALPAGWTGKVWAQQQGVEAASGVPHTPSYLLFTDADISHAPDSLKSLVARAQSGGYVLTSLMAKLRCKSFAERMFIPAFIFFFQMLYPFAWSNNPRRATAAAAGGCMLVRRDVLAEAGGMAAIRGALIDDCALAKKLKARGPIWIGLTNRVHSARAYPAIEDIRHMVSRTAYAQLRYSPLLLVGTVLGLAITYLAPVALAVFATGSARFLGIAAWVLMTLAFQPTLRFYGSSGLLGLAMPAIATTYMAFTLDSAYQHARGRGGMWKGRAQSNLEGNLEGNLENNVEGNISELR
jgi:hopene-associated glycosyltransferase HpnB